MRPHVLLFDEYYTSHEDYRWSSVERAVERVALVIAVGTSFSVGVTEFVQTQARRRGAPVLVVDPAGRADVAGVGTRHFQRNAEDLLPQVVTELARRGISREEAR